MLLAVLDGQQMREIEVACKVCFEDEDEKPKQEPKPKMTNEQIRTVVQGVCGANGGN